MFISKLGHCLVFRQKTQKSDLPALIRRPRDLRYPLQSRALPTELRSVVLIEQMTDEVPQGRQDNVYNLALN